MQDKIIVKVANKTGYQVAKAYDGIDIAYINQNKRRGRVQPQMTSTLSTMGGEHQTVVTKSSKNNTELRIRKLTPKECFRLMGVNDNDSDKILSIQSNARAYKQAGNSIVVDVLYYIFKGMM